MTHRDEAKRILGELRGYQHRQVYEETDVEFIASLLDDWYALARAYERVSYAEPRPKVSSWQYIKFLIGWASCPTV